MIRRHPPSFRTLVALGAFALVAPWAGSQQQSQDQSQQGQQSQQSQDQNAQQPKKKKGFFSGLKSVSGQSSEQQEVTASAGAKGVGEGARIGDVTPSDADRRQVAALEGYALSNDDVKKFQQDGRLNPKP